MKNEKVYHTKTSINNSSHLFFFFVHAKSEAFAILEIS